MNINVMKMKSQKVVQPKFQCGEIETENKLATIVTALIHSHSFVCL